MVEDRNLAFIFDLDGTLYLGDEILPGAKETLIWVRQLGAKVRFVTNNPRYGRDTYSKKLMRLGIPALVDEVVTSAQLTADYLKANQEFGKIFIIGEDQLRYELLSAGLDITNSPNADTVLVSFDTTLTYEKIMTGYQALKNGARFIATNPDPVCPSPDGGLVDAGAIIAALEAATGREIEVIVGKPSKLLGLWLSDQLKTPPKNCIVVGDRLNTDVRLGKQAGMITAWINPTNEKCIDAELKPDIILASIAELPDALSQFFKQGNGKRGLTY
ncbi:NagD protein [Scopulibacillus darangshiensis]|uniref:Acid sugar phosphatase n=1 Tax=Scopulibacillus darangshiensis TaxID=442528 RepID=A0A4R2NQI2_9BACL|nr:HAD-IIA family hydrolase [Scopulibacillus darangshiensis]TCP24080.1 NagD protein [Scopulibacillus darangshiensis]